MVDKLKKVKVPICIGIVALAAIVFVVIHIHQYSPYECSGEPMIFLYGESHGEKKQLEKEFELWHDYYENKGMRDLFVELPYYGAKWLNIWMHQTGDDILMQWYDDINGTLSHNEYVLSFYKKIKKYCPETIFHGTDVGHQYDTSGERYLSYLSENGMENTDEYQIVVECMEQGKQFYVDEDDDFREKAMTENFIREFDSLDGKIIMGIYGDFHADPREDYMAGQLRKHYGDILCYQAIFEMK